MRLNTPTLNQLPLTGGADRPKPQPIPDCDKCGAEQRGNFGIFDAHFCHSCWLLHPTTQKYQLQQLREALKEDQC